MIINKDTFFKIQSTMDFISYDQALGFHDYKSSEEKVYFIDDINNPKICAWGTIQKKIKFISILSIVGEAFSHRVTYKNYKNFYKQIVEDAQHYDIISIINNNKYSTDFEFGIRSAGFTRPLAFFDSPLSVIVDLNKSQKRNRNWQRNLKASEDYSLNFKYISTPEELEISTFVQMYCELSHRKKLGNQISENKIFNLLLDKKFHLFFLSIDDHPIAGRIVYINEKYSYDVYAANSNEIIKYQGASYFMMESIFGFLQDKKVQYFDFGRIGVGRSDGVVNFKLSSGGNIINYNSSWEYSNNKILSSLLSLLRKVRSNSY